MVWSGQLALGAAVVVACGGMRWEPSVEGASSTESVGQADVVNNGACGSSRRSPGSSSCRSSAAATVNWSCIGRVLRSDAIADLLFQYSKSGNKKFLNKEKLEDIFVRLHVSAQEWVESKRAKACTVAAQRAEVANDKWKSCVTVYDCPGTFQPSNVDFMSLEKELRDSALRLGDVIERLHSSIDNPSDVLHCLALAALGSCSLWLSELGEAAVRQYPHSAAKLRGSVLKRIDCLYHELDIIHQVRLMSNFQVPAWDNDFILTASEEERQDFLKQINQDLEDALRTEQQRQVDQDRPFSAKLHATGLAELEALMKAEAALRELLMRRTNDSSLRVSTLTSPRTTTSESRQQLLEQTTHSSDTS